ncbi:MAG: hypothetical protein IH600_06530 [Bacteroidetes bacterium]|nr:hypothetical protein [Bacteroidota bacterium]
MLLTIIAEMNAQTRIPAEQAAMSRPPSMERNCDRDTLRYRGQGPERETQALFYHGQDWGSETQYAPWTLLLNGGFDILQLDRYRRDVFNYPFAQAGRTVFSNLAKPLPLIHRYGWGNFLRNEIFPLEFSEGASWWPNYQLHLIGGGMTYVKMGEWYAQHGFAAPRAWSAATVMTYHLLNEVMENNAQEGELIDPLADIYLFDIGGMLLFSIDDVALFFSRTLHMNEWSLQPTLGVSDMTLRNTGQYFVVKYDLPFWDKYSLIYVFGVNGLAGLTRRFNNGTSLSVAAGLRNADILPETDNPLHLTGSLVWSAGVFYDRENSLLASLILSGISSNLATLNVYPGFVDIAGLRPGCWCTVTTEGELLFGLTTQWGVGLGKGE